MQVHALLCICLINTAYTVHDEQRPWMITAGSTYSSYRFNVLEHLTGISPYFESNADSDGLSPDPPQGCTVERAVYQVRHGSIYVNEFDYVQTIEPFLKRMEDSFDSIDFSKVPELSFISRWKSPISDREEQVSELSKLGFFEAFSLGNRLAYRYPHLMPMGKGGSFRLWVSDSKRTRRSAEALFAGLFSGHEETGKISVISEGKDQGADTLTPTKTCPKFNVSQGLDQARIWLESYTAPIKARLNAKTTGYRFSSNDILAMQELCGYETIIRGFSQFCKIFTPEEWLAFEYYFDIKYYYELGYGNDLSANIGMPWVVATSDLLNQMNNKDQNLYISVAHRQIVPLILTALGLYNDSDDSHMATRTDPILSLQGINYRRDWKSSKFITFLGHIALERLNCTTPGYVGTFVRVLLNSIPKPIPKCASGPGGSCPLKEYTNRVKHRNDLYDDFSKACGITSKNTVDRLSFFSSVKDF